MAHKGQNITIARQIQTAASTKIGKSSLICPFDEPIVNYQSPVLLSLSDTTVICSSHCINEICLQIFHASGNRFISSYTIRADMNLNDKPRVQLILSPF